MPNDVLGRIWNLADREQKGHLGLTEFIIAMHLLASYKNGSMRALPQLLPAGLYEAASRRGVPRQMTGSRPTSDGVAASPIRSQFSGSGYPGQALPIARPQQLPFQQGTLTGDQWAVGPQDKAQFDQIYATLDTTNHGYITGEQAVRFFSNSRLPEEALAQIWDLADINSEGQLNRDEFAVAMFLIRQQRSKKDGRDVLPQSLPPNLIPPSMRRQPIAPQQPTAPAFDNAANITAPKSASEDLFGLDAISSPSPPPGQIQPKTTGDSSPYTSSPPRNRASPTPQQTHQPPSHFKPFVPSSSFGQTMMTPQSTGSPSTASPTTQDRNLPQRQKQPSAMDDLLGDNDPEVSKRLTNETSELANLSNQVSTLTGQMQDIKTKRGSTEQNVSKAQSQKRDFESRLAQLRAAYNVEVKEVESLEERLTASRNEIEKLQQDMGMIQGTQLDLQDQHRQIIEALNMDQNENTNLKENIRQINAEINELKPQLEKMRSDARQQKGLVAINKKQLATNEMEREKVRGDLDGASRERDEASRELEDSKRELEAASQARSPPPAVASPAPSTASMNPFFRRTSNAADKGVTSPFTPQNVTSPNHNAFDSFFEPSFGTSSQPSGPPPSNSFISEKPSTSREMPQTSAAPSQSQGSSDGPDVPTPSASPPPSNFSDSPQIASEPPAPPHSRQITSSFLPLRPKVERSGSESSSVRVMPPGSRMGDRSGFDTPTDRSLPNNEPSIHESPREHFEEMAAKTPRAEPSQMIPTYTQQTPSTSNDGISHQEAAVPDEFSQSSGFPSASRDVPGAFPGDEEPHTNLYRAAAGPYSSSKLDPRVDSMPRSATAAPTSQPANTMSDKPPSLDESFTTARNGSRSPVAAHDDFESAFAGFGDKGKAPDQSNVVSSGDFGASEAPKHHGEFPPIQEFGADDESDSDDDHGFDDNFTAHSANRTTGSGPSQALQAPLVSSEGGLAVTRPPFNTTESNASQLPTPGAQTSPPTYDQTVGSPSDEHGHRKESNQFPAAYSGLLPSREDPTSPPTSPPQSNVGSSAGIDRGLNFFGGDTAEHAAGHAPVGSAFSHDHAPMSPGASNAAPYAYTHGPPPQQTQNYTQSPLATQQSQTYPLVPAKPAVKDDFDGEFGDLSEAKEASGEGDDDFASSRRNDFDEFNPVFDSPAASRHTAQSTASTFPPSDSFTDFESSTSGAGSSSRPTATTETPSHDWDAIFAGLDAPPNNGVQSDIGPRDFSNSVHHHNQQPDAFPSTTQPTQQPSAFPGFVQQNQQPGQAAPKATQKPSLRRVTTEDTEQDDPILKRLTGMGFSRDESLQALENFDYNLDKVR